MINNLLKYLQKTLKMLLYNHIILWEMFLMNSILSFFLVIALMLCSFFAGFKELPSDVTENSTEVSVKLTDSDKALLQRIIDDETAWIASIQLSDGAIPMYDISDGEVSVNPYFADIAAMALLDNAEKYSENVKAYINWHFEHLNSKDEDYYNIDGTIYDYTAELVDGEFVSEKVTVKDGKSTYDSTDSYAATFLSLLRKYSEKTEDFELIRINKDNIERISEAMLSTLNKGLTFAKPDYEVKYLMDNCEVYEGVTAAVYLFDNIIGTDSCNLTYLKLKYAATVILNSVEKYLWNADECHYESGIFKVGEPINEFKWSEYYPCATSQLFPIIHSVIPSGCERAQLLYKKFCDEFNWQDFDIPSDFCWGSNVLTAAKMGDVERVLTYANNYLSFSENHKYPLYNADSARVSMAASILLNMSE